MATSITSNYSGQDSADIVSKALLAGMTLGGEYITINPNVKYKMNIKRKDVTGLLVAGTCGFTDSGTLTLTERVLTLVDIKVNKTECVKDFRPYWDSLEDVTTGLATYYSDVISAQVESLIWNGSTAGGDLIDGFVTLALADATVLDVATPVALTKANIISEIERGLALVPDALLASPNLHIYLNPKDFMYFQQAQNALGQLGNSGLIGLSNYGSFKVVQTGMEKDHYMIADKTNLHFGTNLTSNDNSVATEFEQKANSIHFSFNSAIGVNYAWGAEIVLYGV